MSHPTGSGLLGTVGRLASASIRLPWTLGLWGVQQALGLTDPRRPLDRTADAFDDLSRAASEPLEGPLGRFQRSGDHLQQGLVDAAVRLASGSWREPRAAFERAWGALGRSWDLATRPETGGDR